MPNFRQDVILTKLNQYLKLKKRSLLLTPGGYCHGLTLLWLYKISKGEQQWFYNVIKKIVQSKVTDFNEIEIDVEKLIAHIEWLQYSNKYVKDIQQLDIDKLMETNRELSFSALLSKESLSQILSDILKNKQLFCLSGATHTIGIYNSGQKYLLYDANSPLGVPKEFKDLGLLLKEVVKCLCKDHAKNANISLQINVMSSDEKSKSFQNRFFKTYLTTAPSPQDNQVNTLHLACEAGNLEMTKVLLKQGYNVNLKNSEYKTPLYLAAEFNYLAIVTLLLEHKAVIDLVDDGGNNALHVAARYGHYEIAKTLIAKGLDVLAKNNDNYTPLYYALENEEWETVMLLLLHMKTLEKISSVEMRMLRSHKDEITNEAKRFMINLSVESKKIITQHLQNIYKQKLLYFDKSKIINISVASYNQRFRH